ncbi:MAG TPA: nitroreductase family deazaflavin-dependent oxidoreductase [Acidimicrobiales bacterium]|nr:nitroreductase family deazaflavin-dependent oxidoreductase [Acidimicrobiales bacterium]
MSGYYRRPGWFTRNVLNRTMALMTRLGLSMRGSGVLTVTGRKSGLPRSTPVNVLTLDGARYLVAPRGETEWARNLRVAGTAQLRTGRRSERVEARELSLEEKLPVLRAYLAKWKMETGVFFNGVSVEAGDDQWRQEAQRHPVFLVEKG